MVNPISVHHIRIRLTFHASESSPIALLAPPRTPACLPKVGKYAQISGQKSGSADTGLSPRDTADTFAAPSKIIQPERFLRDVTQSDIPAHEMEIGCLARTRT
jgi:hypothetical protein